MPASRLRMSMLAGRPAGVGGGMGVEAAEMLTLLFHHLLYHVEETQCKGTKAHLTNSPGSSACEMEVLVWP